MKKMTIKTADVGKKEGFNLEETMRLNELVEEIAMGCGDSDCALLTRLQECFDDVSSELEE